MAAVKFTPEEEQALQRSIEALRQFPHLRRAMIEALQMEELFAVPGRLDELTQIVQQILTRLTAVETLATEAKKEAQEAKQAALEAKKEAQEAKQAALEAKKEAQEAKQIALEVRDRVEKLEQSVADLKGDSEELKARKRIPSVLGRYFKKMRIYDSEQMYPLIGETLILDDADATELLYADLFVHAQAKGSQQEYWLVVEVSWGVGVSDVRRTHERAAILQKYGYLALGVAMGRAVTRDAERLAKELGVLVAHDGKITGAQPPQ